MMYPNYFFVLPQNQGVKKKRRIWSWKGGSVSDVEEILFVELLEKVQNVL